MAGIPPPIWVNIGLVAALFILMRLVFRQRAWLANHAREMESLAKRLGYRYEARMPDDELKSLGERSRLFRGDRSTRIEFRNVISGLQGEVGFRMVDFKKTTVNGKGERHSVTAFGMVIFDEVIPLPNFSLGKPLPWFGVKLANWMLDTLFALIPRPKGAAGRPRFYDLSELGGGLLARVAAKHYQLFAGVQHEDELFAVLSARTMEFLAKNPGWVIQVENGVLAAYKTGRVGTNEKYDAVLRSAIEIRNTFADAATNSVRRATPFPPTDTRKPA